MSNTNRDLLLKIYKELQETKDKVKDIPEMKKQLEEIPKIKKQLEEIPKIKKQLEEIPKIKKQLEEIPKIKKQLEEIPKIKKQLEEIPEIKKQLEEIPEIKQELRNISGSVARIEVEHGEKLAVLFDAFKVNTEKIEEQNKRLTKCEKMLEKHDHQIYILNSKIQNT